MRHVCERCNGNGWVDKWKGGMTRSDLDRMFMGDYEEEQEFLQEYIKGTYGDPCPVCKGNKVVDDFVCVKCKETRLPGEDDFVWTKEAIEDAEVDWEPGTECTVCNYDYEGAAERAYFDRAWAI